MAEQPQTYRDALEALAQAEAGKPFGTLGISNPDFLYLVDDGLIAEPNGSVIDIGDDRMVIHGGNVTITPKGQVALDLLRKNDKEALRTKKRESLDLIRWSITAAIAIAALIVSIIELAVK